MITLADMGKAPARIAHLKQVNDEARERIVRYREEEANFWQTINAQRGIRIREAEIQELEAALVAV